MIKAGDYYLDLDLVDDNDYVLDLGVGGDYDFSNKIREHKAVKVVAVDPTEKANRFHHSVNLDFISFINKAVHVHDNDTITLYRNKNPNFVSDSVDPHIKDVGNDTYTVETVGIESLIKEYNPVLIKMDIEGAEYDIYERCVGVPQICMETHDYRTDRSNTRDLNMIHFFLNNGYLLTYTNNRSLYTFAIDMNHE